jgi:serine/threonine protein phosphatase PrpC
VRFRVGARTDVGRVREGNEDSYMVHEPLYAVADGMGGHQGGEVASNLALAAMETIAEEPVPDGDSAPRLAEVVREANRVVLQRAGSDPGLSGMGTTLTAVLAGIGGRIHVAHVGDSRAYLLRGGEMSRLTRDQTVVQRLVDEGRISPEEAEIHPQRSILTNAIGVDRDIEVDEASYELAIGDRLLLCSDGLSGMVSEADIKRILVENEDPQAACDALVEAANQAGGQDNITALILDAVEDQQVPAEPTVVAPPTVADERAQEARVAPTTQAAVPPAAEAPPGEAPAAAAEPQPPAPPELPPAGEPSVPAGEPSVPAEEVASAGDRYGFGPGRTRGARARRVLLWILIPLLLIAGGLFAVKRLFIDNQWFVGVSDAGNVALFRGVPAEPLGFELFTLESETGLQASQVSQLRPEWSNLADGITEESQEGAQAIIEEMRTATLRQQPEPDQGTQGGNAADQGS